MVVQVGTSHMLASAPPILILPEWLGQPWMVRVFGSAALARSRIFIGKDNFAEIGKASGTIVAVFPNSAKVSLFPEKQEVPFLKNFFFN